MYTGYMKKYYPAIFIVLIAIIGYLVYDKMTAQTAVAPQEQKQVQAETPATTTPKKVPLSNTSDHDCLISAENFFEKKRAGDVDLLGADWDAYLDASTGICFVKITDGSIYDTATGDRYRLQGTTYLRTSN
jgi:hypothetical protein